MRQLAPPAAAPVSTSPMPMGRTGVRDQGGWVRSGGAKGSVLGGGACLGRSGAGVAGGGSGGPEPGAAAIGTGATAQAAARRRSDAPAAAHGAAYFPVAFRVTSRWKRPAGFSPSFRPSM